MSINVVGPRERTSTVLSQYDTDVDYLSYWTARSYEHRAEVMALSRLLQGRRFGHAVDVGGGYGRLSVVLRGYADRVTLADPSYRQLEVAERYLETHSAIETRLTDAAHLDFDPASVDLAVMVRVLHHLPDPAQELSEIARIVRPGGYAIIEAANVKHAVNRVRYWLSGRRIPTTPVDIRSEANRISESIPFVNHHPAAITRQLAACGLLVERVLSVSNLRQPALKRLMPERVMLAAEYAMQVPLASLSFGPSLFFMARKQPAV
ncbi:MAG: class I SAM-dependent methyltransferase [Streptosporangiaceae bacterium]|jgi:ubiquinone/menaquinone biosynthesis C-methylase UbiE